MRPLIALSVIALPLIALGACASHNPTAPATVGPEYVRAGGLWDSGGGIEIAAGVREEAGLVAVCGAWRHSEQSVLTKSLNRDIVATGIVYLGGERVLTNLTFMAEAPKSSPLEGRTAPCVVAERAWAPGDALAPLAIHLPRRDIELDSEDGNRVRFRQTHGSPSRSNLF